MEEPIMQETTDMACIHAAELIKTEIVDSDDNTDERMMQEQTDMAGMHPEKYIKTENVDADDNMEKPIMREPTDMAYMHTTELFKTENIDADNCCPVIVCKVCNKVLGTSASPHRPPCVHNGELVNVCEACYGEFFLSSYLPANGIISTVDEHPTVDEYICETCGKEFINLANLRVHVLIHTRNRRFVCEICDKGFAQSSGLSHHKKTHPVGLSFICETCGKDFANASNLRIHTRIHSGRRQFVCKICDKTFSQSSGLSQHKRTHAAAPQEEHGPINCETCGKEFSNASNLRIHVLIHTEKRRFVCQTCGKGFAQSAGLYQHKKKHHLNHSETSSPVFTQQNDPVVERRVADVAEKKVNAGERRFACNICDKEFEQAASLHQHKKIHFESEQSSGASTQQNGKFDEGGTMHSFGNESSMVSVHKDKQIVDGVNNLQNPTKLYRTNDLPFYCTLCDEQFAQYSSLCQHRQSHSSERQYECELCNERFAQFAALYQHRRKHHSSVCSQE